MRRVGSIKEAIKWINNSRDIYIVGAGKDGKECCRELIRNGFHIRNFIDEDKKKENKIIEGVKVVLPDNIIMNNANNIFLFCIGEINFYCDEHIRLLPICSCIKDENNIIIIDKCILTLNKFVDDCQKFGVTLSNPLIKITDIILPNFLLLSDDVKKVFLTECNDLIMPACFDDYSMIDEGPYEIDEVQIMKNDIVIDAGANLGLFSAYAASKIKESEEGMVYAFEPIPQTVELLERTSELYPDKIRIIEKALSKQEGTALMTDMDFIGQNRICRYEFDNKKIINVDIITIDKFVESFGLNRVDFIKADIEGEERNMLLGAKKVLKEFSPRLAICTYHKEDDPCVIEDIIKKINPNYKFIHRYKKIYAYV